MTWNGFLPPSNCQACGTPLQGEDSDRPAELYAGTYTGLCYPCTGKTAFRIETRQRVSGAWYWSHPPHCPSWRRDRETFYGFPGCKRCGGKGCTWISRPNPQGGPYTVQCVACEARDEEHPYIARAQGVDQKRRAAIGYWQHRITREWAKRLKKFDRTPATVGPREDWSDDIKAVADQIFKDAPPPPPRGQDAPALPAFPKGWARGLPSQVKRFKDAFADGEEKSRRKP